MADRPLPPPNPDWDNPKPCTAPDPALTAALGKILGHVPDIRKMLDIIERDGVTVLRGVFTDDVWAHQWTSLAEALSAASDLCLRMAVVDSSGHE